MQTPSINTRNATTILACGSVFDQHEITSIWLSDRFQRALRDARQRFGHALCQCRRWPLKLQIRERDNHCHLAVWPHEGPAHDSECIYFRDDVATGALPPGATEQPPPNPQAPKSPTDPRTPYRLDGRSQCEGAVISVRTLATRLWERASLCRWHPTWSRDWGRTRYELMKAAAELTLDGTAGEDVLFIPRPYRESQQIALNSEWDHFTRSITIHRGLTRLLVAPVRKMTVRPSDDSAVLHFRHLRTPMGLSASCFDFISRDCRGALRSEKLLQGQGGDLSRTDSTPEAIGFFLVEGSSRGGVWAKAGWLLSVHPRLYIPAANSDTVLLVDRLVEQGYSFQRILSDAPPSKRQAADWLVRHVLGPDGKPVARSALEILDRGASPDYLAARTAIAERMQREGIPTWTWVPEGKRADRHVPPLPPHDHAVPQAAALALRQLQTHPFADYRFGASTKFSTPERTAA
jgi:hypothetical protein